MLFDMSLLVVVMYHALNGVWNIILDFNISELAKKIVGWIFFGIGIIASFVGFVTLSSFVK
jgi:succinate dehydrogenase hydrophobic anchor subunit